jgi:hypothetical protein
VRPLSYLIFDAKHHAAVLIDEDDALAEVVVQSMPWEGAPVLERVAALTRLLSGKAG